MSHFQSPPHLLITDDDWAFRESLGAAFRTRGFRTSLASDGLAALNVIRQQQVHLLLLDLQMPTLSGLDTMRRLREEQVAVPWILISGGLDESVVAEAEALSVYTVLAKPIRFQDATQVVLQALRDIYHWEPSSS